MREYRIETIEYGIDTANCVRRALRGAEGVGVSGEGGSALIKTRDEEARERLCMALCRILLIDAAAEEMRIELKAYDFDEEELRRALNRGMELFASRRRRAAMFAYAISCLMEYTRTESTMNIEGFLRFRLNEARETIYMCALCAAAEELIRREMALHPELFDMRDGDEAIVILIRPWDGDNDGSD